MSDADLSADMKDALATQTQEEGLMDCQENSHEKPAGSWELVTGGSGCKRNIPDNRDPRKMKKTENEVTISNRFEVLAETNNAETNEQSQTAPTSSPNTTNPPPIYITDVQNYAALVSYLQIKSGPDTFLLKTTTKGVTVFPNTPNDYRRIVSSLRTSGAAFHTYQLFEDRNPRVVIKNLHHNTPVEYIKNDLEKYGYQVIAITNAISRFKRPLPMFFVDINKATYNEKIFEITKIFHTCITIEEPRKKKHIPQCLRCQQYGHTRSYCNYAPRCVRCGQSHDSSSCTKNRNTPANCANCQGEHPANYRGCQTLKDLRAQKNKRNKVPQRAVTPPPVNPKEFPHLPQPTRRFHQPQQQKLPQQRPPQQIPNQHYPPQVTQRGQKQTASRTQNTRPPAAMSEGTIQPHSEENYPSPQLFQILNSLHTLIQPLFSLLQQLAQVTQGMCLQNGQ